MLTVASKDQLRQAFRKLTAYQSKEEHYRSLVEKYRKMIVQYFQKKNIKEFEDDSGQIWQRRQPIRLVYKQDDLKALLRRKGIKTDIVFKREMVESVDEDAVSTLLKNRVITVKEFEEVVVRQAYNPYIARVARRKNGKT